MDYYFGVDIGGTTVKIGLLNAKEELIDKWEIKTNIFNHGESILSDVASSIKNYLVASKIKNEEIIGIGFGVPGPVVGSIVKSCVNLGWVEKDVKKEFLKYIDFNPKIYVGNDANVAAYGETKKGSNKKYDNAVMLTLGTGVGGGVVINGLPISGTNGAAGELGHLKIDHRYHFRCNCGLDGCLETVASATGIVRIFKHHLENHYSVLSGREDLTCKDIFDAAKANDELSLKVLDEVGYYLGEACSILSATLDPEVFIIGGGVSRAGKILIDAIEKYYHKFAFHSTANTPFTLATLGNDGGMYGAALLAKAL